MCDGFGQLQVSSTLPIVGKITLLHRLLSGTTCVYEL